jgi:glycosyltransferase involved in cell wall biosynthesis
MTPSSPAGLTLVLDALAARFGGTAYAAVQLAAALDRHPAVGRVLVACRRGSIVDRGTTRGDGVHVLGVPARRRSELAQRIAWEALVLPRLVRAHAVDGLMSFSGMLPRPVPCPVICLQANPVPYEERSGVAAAVRRSAFARTARAAVATYVPSTHVAGLLRDLPRVRVVPLGVDRHAFAPADWPGAELLYVSDFYAHKHHELVLAAYSALASPRPVLRLVGNPDVEPAAFARVARTARGLPGVAVDGHVSFDALRAAYRAAAIFVMASERESFSMPLAEAICAGVPAVARDHPALRETAGAGALYVQGNDPSAWTAAVQRLLDDSALHARLRSAAIAQGQRYSWELMADQLVADVVAAGRRR